MLFFKNRKSIDETLARKIIGVHQSFGEFAGNVFCKSILQTQHFISLSKKECMSIAKDTNWTYDKIRKYFPRDFLEQR